MKLQAIARAVALLSLCLLPVASGAKTPDGMTPAEETVCDELQGAKRGLYGLCVAYCEAQDCDSIELAISGQCRAPKPRLLELYERKRRAEDPPMPCVTPETQPCSCFDAQELAMLPLDACFSFDFGGTTATVLSDGSESSGALVEHGEGFGQCALIGNGETRVFEIGEDEALACEVVLRDHAAGLGLSCP